MSAIPPHTTQSSPQQPSQHDLEKLDQERIQREEEKERIDAEKSEENAKFNELRLRILESSLQFVPIHGWARDSISKGAESLGYPGVVHGMFPNGGIELVQYFYEDCNRKLGDHLKAQHLNQKDNETKSIKPKDFAREAIKIRLTMMKPYLKFWPQAVALMSLPQNASKSLANLLTLVDDICYFSGDRAVDVRNK